VRYLANNIDDRLRSACQLLSATIAIAMLKNNQADASIKVGSKGTTNISKRPPRKYRISFTLKRLSFFGRSAAVQHDHLPT
jgi:hypothetical protein